MLIGRKTYQLKSEFNWTITNEVNISIFEWVHIQGPISVLLQIGFLVLLEKELLNELDEIVISEYNMLK